MRRVAAAIHHNTVQRKYRAAWVLCMHNALLKLYCDLTYEKSFPRLTEFPTHPSTSSSTATLPGQASWPHIPRGILPTILPN
jgi:hypothetical protein